MLKTLNIENFKCLNKFEREFGALTLLTGLNAAGKSSVIQCIALLHQSITENEWGRSILLNGSTVELGTMVDVIDRNSGGKGFAIEIGDKSWRCRWETTSSERKRELVGEISLIRVTNRERSLEWNKEELENLPIRRLVPETISVEDAGLYSQLQFVLTSISYISAERLGPREVYSARTPMTNPDVGAHGEYTALCLEQFADDKCNPGLILPGVADTVRLMVQAWMGQVFGGFGYEIRRIDGTNLVSMGIRTSPNGEMFRPTNVGYGLTHVLPIVTACVTAKPGRILLIENPETHLHPAAQSLIGSFLALAASKGVQLIVETHSDHVLNGVRRAVRDGKLSPEETKIYFLQSEFDKSHEQRTSIVDILVDRGGKLDKWPAGFFDQYETDLDHIFR